MNREIRSKARSTSESGYDMPEQNREDASREPRAVVLLRQAGILVAILVLMVSFTVSDPRFISWMNLQNILRQVSITTVLGVGMTMVILVGRIDLSVGSSVLLSAVVMNSLIENQVLPVALAVLAGLLAASLVGFLNALLIERAKISTVIVTLGMMIAIRGVGQIILWINNTWLWVRAPLFRAIKTETFLGIPLPALIMLAVVLIASVVLRRSPFGRRIYAVGVNDTAARFCGVSPERIRSWVFVLSGLCAGFGGLLVSARLSAVSPNVGNGMEFQAITAVILGGTRFSGGVGSVEKTVLGAIAIGMILNFMTIKGISAQYQQAATGFIILLAATIDRATRGRTR